MAKRSELAVGKSVGKNLQAEKLRLDKRVDELKRRAFLTPTEQIELAELKKQKLLLKDQLHA
jgi:uncharacterized protein YdcH (DUF465 family)